MRFNKLNELLKAQQEELKRLSQNIDRLSKQFDFEFPTDFIEDEDELEPDVIMYYEKCQPQRPSATETECFWMAMSNLTLEQLFMLKDALEAKEQYSYCQMINQRILDLKAAEIRRSKLNDFLR